MAARIKEKVARVLEIENCGRVVVVGGGGVGGAEPEVARIKMLSLPLGVIGKDGIRNVKI